MRVRETSAKGLNARIFALVLVSATLSVMWKIRQLDSMDRFFEVREKECSRKEAGK